MSNKRSVTKKPSPPTAASQEEPESESWWARNADALTRDLGVGLLVGVLVLIAGFVWDSRLAERDEINTERLAMNAEMLENVRFLRNLDSRPNAPKPLRDLYLRGAVATDLVLTCPGETSLGASCPRLDGADLRESNLAGGEFERASFSGARLNNARLQFTRFTSSYLLGSDFSGADLSDSIITKTDLRSVDFSRAKTERWILRDVCYDDATVWPEDVELPASQDEFCQLSLEEQGYQILDVR